MQIADAAHAKGIIHREPSNVFIANRDQAKLLDFSLAKFSNPQFAGDNSGIGGTTTCVPRLPRGVDIPVLALAPKRTCSDGTRLYVEDLSAHDIYALDLHLSQKRAEFAQSCTAFHNNLRRALLPSVCAGLILTPD